MKKIVFTFFLLAFSSAQWLCAQTWADDIAPIMYNNCTVCHRTGGIAPFPIETYNDAVTNANAIAMSVLNNQMPPWMPDPTYRHFKDERYLTQTEIAAIASWASNGTPEGNPANAPAVPVFPSGSQLPQVDKTLTLPSYTVTSNIDEYRSFSIPAGVSVNTYINSIDYIPGNDAIVHHIVIYSDPNGLSQLQDAQDPGPGFASNGNGPVLPGQKWLGAWAPGAGPFVLPANMGLLMPAGGYYVVEMHYAPGSAGQSDVSVVNLAYTNASPIREVKVDPLLLHTSNMTDGPLSIPANTVKTFHEKYKVPSDQSVLTVFPHMHLIAKSVKSYGIDPANNTIPFINIPNWDFHWQGFYTFQKIQKILKDTYLWAEATYDNTANNPANPSNPPQNVTSGEHTTDEMMIVFFAYTNYQTGDEDIVLDSTILNATPIAPVVEKGKLFAVFPNPVSDVCFVTIHTDANNATRIELMNELGEKVLTRELQNAGQEYISESIDMQALPNGLYFVKVTNGNESAVQKVWK